MQDSDKTREELLREIAELRARLAEPEETVHAIRRGEVDAFVVLSPGGEQVYTLDSAERALHLLAEAGERLSESLDYETTLDNAARLVVPALADCCLIDLLDEGGKGRRVVSRHADPAREPLMRELKNHPVDPASLLFGVLETGEPLLLPEISSSLILSQLRSDDHARVIEQLAPRSALAVPLVARGRTLGVWTFLYSESGRQYGEAELRVALELARRAALALDNARLYREVESANRAKDHFLATLSHELRTPLTPVLAIASRLRMDGRLRPEVREGLDVIHRNVELEARLIDDLLDLTRITRGKLELHSAPTDLRQVLLQALETCGEREMAARHLTLDLAETEHRVWGDPSRLTQVFWNLLRNALKFTPEGGTIAVRSQVEPSPDGSSFLAVEIADSGIGIEPEALPHIFDAFDQGAAGTTRRFGGLGLGLAISRAIVELHGGRLTAASEGRGRGAVFTVRLPRLAALPAGMERPGESLLPGPAPEPPAGERPLHILLVEDHSDTAAAMAGLLKAVGHRVTVAGTVAAALAAADEGSFDLVLSDLGLPDGHGHELMRTLSGRHSLPGIALSGYGMEDDIAKSREAGFLLHITKPVGLETLVAAIRRIAQGPPQVPEKA